jgi:hypothetical protein
VDETISAFSNEEEIQPLRGEEENSRWVEVRLNSRRMAWTNRPEEEESPVRQIGVNLKLLERRLLRLHSSLVLPGWTRRLVNNL